MASTDERARERPQGNLAADERGKQAQEKLENKQAYLDAEHQPDQDAAASSDKIADEGHGRERVPLMNAQGTPRAAWLLLPVLVVACSKAGTTESRPSGAPAPPSPTAVADAATAPRADAAAPDAHASFGKDNASGPQLGPAVDENVAQRTPGRDLRAQLGGDAPPPTAAGKPIATRVTLSSHRALGSTSLDSSKVAGRYLGAGQKAVKRCYESALAREPATTGTLTLRFAITTTGHVTDATAETAESWNAALSKCVLEAMPTWTFPAPEAQARFELVLSLVTE